MDPLGGVTFQGWPLRGCRNSTDACSSANQTSRSLVIKSLDCGLVAPGSNFNIWNITAYDNTHVNPKDGLAFDLYSNLYAVNYPMWYPWRSQDATTRFRFNILEFWPHTVLIQYLKIAKATGDRRAVVWGEWYDIIESGCIVTGVSSFRVLYIEPKAYKKRR